MCSNYPGIKLEPALETKEDKIEHLSSYAHVVYTTAKQVISRRRKNENVYKCQKMKNARAKRAKILFSIVRYANLWGPCCRRRRGYLSSLKLKQSGPFQMLSFFKEPNVESVSKKFGFS